MKSSSKKHLRRTLLCALVAGSIAAPFAAPHAYALPIEGANAATNAGEANISTSGTVMDITGKTEHNVLRWEDFSIEQNEKVCFDGGNQERDYLNLVTGEGASNIYGMIEGGRNVYLVNPHGILFAAGSQVNTGALYLSTAKPDDIAAATNTFKTNGTSPLSATAQMGDVLNLGTVKASKLYIEGKNVKVLNTDDIQNTDGTALTRTNVKIRSAETPHIGYDVGNYDYANPNTSKSASGRGWEVTNLGGTAHTDYDYMRVNNVYDLQNINAKRDGRYILAGDIDATATRHWNSGEGFAPLGSYNGFTGRFDGAGHTLRGLHINRHNFFSTGLFGYTVGAHIENISLVDGDVEGNFEVGGIVGRADGTVIRNVSYAGRVDGMRDVGGIVGCAQGGSEIQNVCNTGAITGNEKVGGIAGYTWSTTLQNAWNTGTVTGSQKVGGIVGEADGGTVRHAVSKTGSAGQAVGSSISGADVTTDVKVASEADMKLAATYTDWKDGSGNAIVATDGGKGTPWRIYEGHTMPLLTALMKGTKRLEKVYDGNVFATTDPHITLVNTGKNVGTYDAYSDQLGYDLIGGATIKPRALTIGAVAAQSKTYDGTTAADISQFSATLNNVVSGEESLVTATVTGAAYNSKDVRAANAVNYTGVALGGTGAGNYTLAASTAQGAGSITAKQLNLALASGTRFDKTYDGNANVAQSLTKDRNYTLTNFVNGEGADIALAPVTGTYTDKNAGTGKAVTFGGLTLTGAGAGNYSLSTTTLTTTGDIARKTLTLEGTAGTQFTKTYDGNATVTQNLVRGMNYRLAGVVAGEGTDIVALNESAAQGAYVTKDAQAAGAQQNVIFTNLALTGSGAANYTLAANKTFENAGRITPKELNLALASGARFDKTYDGNANVAQSLTKDGNYSLTGFVTGAGNYTLDKTSLTGIGTIALRALTLGAVAAQSKTYDGTTDADTTKFGAVLNNVVAGDSVTVAATTATFNDKNVAAANRIDYTGVALAGADAGNYSLAATTAQGAGTIAKRSLTIGAVAQQSKTYDGTTMADASQFSAALHNVVTGEEGSVTATAAGAAYNDKKVAAANTVGYTGVALTGTGAGNYSIANTAQGTGRITPRALTLGAVESQSKTYDGTTAADASKFGAALNNVIEGDNVTTAAAGAAYNDKNVAAANRIDYTGVALRGADAGNYSIANTAQGAGTITHRELTLSAAPHSIVQGEALPSFTGQASGFADGEDERVFGTDGITFGTTLTNTDTPGSYGLTGRIGSTSDGVLGNYRIRQAAGNANAFTIHAAALPGGILASLVQNAAPRFDMGFGQEVYVFGLPRRIPTARLGIYRFAPTRDLDIEGLRLD